MSIWEECAVYVAEPMEEDEARDLSRQLRIEALETRYHDRNGYLAELAGSPKCLALGHAPDPEEGWDTGDAHPIGWADEPLCIATRSGSACTECESDDCDRLPLDRDAFWALFTAPEEIHEVPC